MKKTYLAYGSNMDILQMEIRCPGARLIGRGYLEGWRLAFRGSGSGNYSTIEEAPGQRVPLVVWEIDAEAERALDRYEGFPTFYYKKELPFTRLGDDGSEKQAARGMAYIMEPARPYGLPSRPYYERIIDAYADFGFDEQFMTDALSYTRRRMR